MAALKSHTLRISRAVRISRRPNFDRTTELALPTGYDIDRDLEAELANPDERSAHPSEADVTDDMFAYFEGERARKSGSVNAVEA